MKMLLLLIVLVSAVVSYAAFTAQNTNITLEGYNWATRFCSSAHGLCAYPQDLAYTAIGFAVLWIVMMLLKT